MPFTHVEIEERKSRIIVLLFAFLVLLYVVSIIVLLWGAKWLLALEGVRFFPSRGYPSSLEIVVILSLSIIVACIHWFYSTRNLCARVLWAINARALDSRDTYHQKLANIVNEVSIATGFSHIEPFVIPTPALNACAISDFSGRSAIALTEGALAMLNREQLESVVGHEAAHIVSGDSLTTSVLCGLFALHEEALKRLCGLFRSGDNRGVFRIRGRGALLILFAIAVLWLTTFMKKVCEMLISREKEYRADAVAVRLTRNPISLAEALSIISNRWRGIGTRGESLSSIFILDPGTERLSEEEGLFADLFSTHPPTERRLQLLLGMAHIDTGRFEEEMLSNLRKPHSRSLPAPIKVEAENLQWLIWDGKQWTGPFGLDKLSNDTQLVPDSWVRRAGESATSPAYQDPQLLEILQKRYTQVGSASASGICPRCRIGLILLMYEGTPIETCPACNGCYVDSDTMVKVFTRQEYDFPESVKRRGDFLLTQEGYAFSQKALQGISRVPMKWSCPKCGAGLVRKLYTEAYPVEVEQCWRCSTTWLDNEELELLQYLHEKRRSLHVH